MTKRNRRTHSPALNGDKTLAELAQQFDVHPNQIADWKKQRKRLGKAGPRFARNSFMM